MTFDEMRTAWKRAEHFCGPEKKPARWACGMRGMPKHGAGVIAHNYAAMQSKDDAHIDRVLWCHEMARALNRYVDTHRIAGDESARRALGWWRAQMLLNPTSL